MSRIGKLPVTLEKGVTARLDGAKLTVSGPKGTLTHVLPDGVTAAIEDGKIQLSRRDDHRERRSLHGLTRALVQNIVTGVAKGFERKMEMVGVGYKAEVKGKQLHLALGFSHPVVFDLPEGVTAEVAKTPRTEDQLPTIDVTLRAADRQLLGETAVRIRNLRPPEPYKGKGIKLHDETVRRKEGKTGTA